jgi:hypothetical protein
VTLSNSGNIGLTGATVTSPAVPVVTACPAVTLEPGQSAAGCSVSVASVPKDFEQGGMWFNVTAAATSRADNAAAAITGEATYYQTLVQSRKLAATFVADPASTSSAGMFGFDFVDRTASCQTCLTLLCSPSTVLCTRSVVGGTRWLSSIPRRVAARFVLVLQCCCCAAAAAAAETPVTLTLTVANAGNVKVAGVSVTSGAGLACDQADGALFDLAVGASNVCRYVFPAPDPCF